MSNKMHCPVCDSYTSSIYLAVQDGQPCPTCEAPADVILRLNDLREKHGESLLATEVERLTIALSKAELRADRAEQRLDRIKRAVAEAVRDDVS